MNKLAFACACACISAGNAMAQSNVTVYGQIDLALARETGLSATGAATRLDSGVQSGSRLGFKGSEDLGGGLAVNFVLENGLLADTGAADQNGTLFGRQAWLGMSGKFGAVRIGRQNTPLYNTALVLDPFAAGLAGDESRLIPIVRRMDNTVLYVIPKVAGMSGEIAYGLGEQPGDFARLHVFSMGLGYEGGPALVRLVYHNANTAASAVAVSNTAKNTTLGGIYNFGPFKLHLVYTGNKNNTTLDTRDVLTGVTVPIGPHTMLASVVSKKDRFNINADATQYSVGYTYKFSARANFYSSYAQLRNEGAAAYKVAKKGDTNTLANAGVRYTF